MSYSQPVGTRRRGARSIILAALVVGATLVAVLGHRSPASWPWSAAVPTAVKSYADRPIEKPHGERGGGRQATPSRALGVADGKVPDGVTVYDDRYPAVANLDPALLGALRRAARHAERDGVELYVNSGWRSRAYQERLLVEAVDEYGSTAEAARWVATADTSPHVAGDAVDLGHSLAIAWLAEHGPEHGLCQIYRNEPWHYELRPEAVEHGCPPLYADPTHDPRMRR